MLKRARMILTVTCTMAITVMAQQPGESVQPGVANKKLGVFVGTWKDEAEMKPGPFGPGGKLSLTETCDWFTGGFSVVCTTETNGFLGDLKTLTVMTYDREENGYRLYEFNSLGWSNAAKGTVEGNTWKFEGESKMGGKVIKSRSTITLPFADSATMKSELSVDGGPWSLLMELKGIRVKPNLSDFHPCVPHASEGWVFECYQVWLGSH